jgi:hypothetical protein
MENDAMPVRISLIRINRLLGLAVVLLSLAGFASEASIHLFADEWGFGLVPLVNLAYEGNIPTWYSSTLLFLCALLLALIAGAKLAARQVYARHWAAMAVIFVYLSMDESVVIHELINSALELEGVLTFSWVLPFGALVLVFIACYLGFLRHLSARFRTLFLLAGAIYVGGALGTELPIGAWYDRHGGDNMVYGMLNVVQETMEILGATIFCSTLACYIRDELGELRVAFIPPPGSPSRPASAGPTR